MNGGFPAAICIQARLKNKHSETPSINPPREEGRKARMTRSCRRPWTVMCSKDPTIDRQVSCHSKDLLQTKVLFDHHVHDEMIIYYNG
jgi:hypothetical protein